MYGLRARLGFMIHCSDITIESDIFRMKPKGVSVHFTRMMVHGTTVKALQELTKEIERPAELLHRADVDAIAFACTSGSFIMGPRYDEEIINRISKVAPESKVTTTATAVIRAINKLNIEKIAIATPYTDKINELEQRFVEVHGFEVVNIKGLGMTGREISKVTPEEIYEFTKSVCVSEADGIFISCTGLRAVDVIGFLESDLGKPVITSNQATLWDMLNLTNVHEEIKNFGKLLATL